MGFGGAHCGGIEAAFGGTGMTDVSPYISAFLIFAGTVAAVGMTRHILVRYRIFDVPNERSSHSRPTPRGGGIGALAILLPAWAYWGFSADGGATSIVIVAGACFLGLVSWLDDLKGLGPVPRLLAHFAVAGLAVWAGGGAVFGGLLPGILDGMAATFMLVWFINLFNFMDGIDGITGVETLVIGFGVFTVAALAGRLDASAYQGLMMAMAALGFLVWNWPPARIFVGDVGSTVFGFLLGWLLLQMAADGNWLGALILPLYYLADSGWTLTRRLLRGENITQAHKTHFYQRAVQNGHSHAKVSLAVLGIGILLIAHAGVTALFASSVAWPALLSATACVGLLLVWMKGKK